MTKREPKEKIRIPTREAKPKPGMFDNLRRREQVETVPLEDLVGPLREPAAPKTQESSPAESTSLAPVTPLALRGESLVESVSPVENISLVESTVDFWDALKEWKEGFQQIPNMIALVLYRHLDPAERAVYGELFQLSWGFGNSTCKVSLPRLAERSGMKQTATHQAVKRLVAMGLVQKSRMEFGKGKEQGITYSLPLPARLMDSIRLARNIRLTDSVNNKINTQKENTQTQDAPAAGVRVGSKFTIEECRKYAEHLRSTGQGINNPGGYATTIHRTGEADELIDRFLSPASASAQADTTACPDCQGTGFYYPKGIDQGVAKCPHSKLTTKTF